MQAIKNKNIYAVFFGHLIWIIAITWLSSAVDEVPCLPPSGQITALSLHSHCLHNLKLELDKDMDASMF